MATATRSRRAPPRKTTSERESTEQARAEIRRRERRQAQGRLAYIWQNYSLSIVLLAMTICSLVLHFWFGWMQFAADQAAHGQAAEMLGSDGYWIYFGEWTMQNWQSEFLQTFLMISLTAWFIHRGSPESKDGQEEMALALARIEKRLERIEAAR